MESMQQTVFRNLSKSSVYNSQTKKVTQKQQSFPKYRYQEIQNQFDLVDIHDKGKITQEQIVAYLQQKYQWVNMNIVNQLFKSFSWQQGAVTKKEFCDKYIARERKLFHQLKRLNNFQSWSRTQQEIYKDNQRYDPKVYVFSQISNVELYHENQLVEWMDLTIEYQNHKTGITYRIQQPSHEHDDPSFQVWLPSQQQTFFVKLTFTSSTNNDIVYGRTYIKQEFQSPQVLTNSIKKNKNLTLDITLSNKIVGHCNAVLKLQTSLQIVRNELRKNRRLQSRYLQSYESKVKEYQYLNFLWGMKYKSPQKVSQLDVPWMIGIRTIMLILIGVTGLIAHIYGRYEPLSLIISVLLLRNRLMVLMRVQKFLLTWLTLLAVLLDIIWLVFSSNHLSEINFFSLTIAKIATFILLGSKGILLFYLIFIERSFES